MHSEKLAILKMIEQGRVTAEEGARLLEALDAATREPPPQPLRRLRLLISELGSGRRRGEAIIPIPIIEFGLALALRGRRHLRLGRRELDPEVILSAVREGRPGRILEYTDDRENARVEAFLE